MNEMHRTQCCVVKSFNQIQSTEWQVAIFFSDLLFLFQLVTGTFEISWRADLLGLVRLLWIAARAVPDARTLISSRDRFPDAGTFFLRKKCNAFNQTPEIKGCLCLTIHIATALHLFSACALDVTSTVMTRMHVRSSMCAHSPLSGSSVNKSSAQDTE